MILTILSVASIINPSSAEWFQNVTKDETRELNSAHYYLFSFVDENLEITYSVDNTKMVTGSYIFAPPKGATIDFKILNNKYAIARIVIAQMDDIKKDCVNSVQAVANPTFPFTPQIDNNNCLLIMMPKKSRLETDKETKPINEEDYIYVYDLKQSNDFKVINFADYHDFGDFSVVLKEPLQIKMPYRSIFVAKNLENINFACDDVTASADGIYSSGDKLITITVSSQTADSKFLYTIQYINKSCENLYVDFFTDNEKISFSTTDTKATAIYKSSICALYISPHANYFQASNSKVFMSNGTFSYLSERYEMKGMKIRSIFGQSLLCMSIDNAVNMSMVTSQIYYPEDKTITYRQHEGFIIFGDITKDENPSFDIDYLYNYHSLLPFGLYRFMIPPEGMNLSLYQSLYVFHNGPMFTATVTTFNETYQDLLGDANRSVINVSIDSYNVGAAKFFIKPKDNKEHELSLSVISYWTTGKFQDVLILSPKCPAQHLKCDESSPDRNATCNNDRTWTNEFDFTIIGKYGFEASNNVKFIPSLYYNYFSLSPSKQVAKYALYYPLYEKEVHFQTQDGESDENEVCGFYAGGNSYLNHIIAYEPDRYTDLNRVYYVGEVPPYYNGTIKPKSEGGLSRRQIIIIIAVVVPIVGAIGILLFAYIWNKVGDCWVFPCCCFKPCCKECCDRPSKYQNSKGPKKFHTHYYGSNGEIHSSSNSDSSDNHDNSVNNSVSNST